MKSEPINFPVDDLTQKQDETHMINMKMLERRKKKAEDRNEMVLD